MSRRCTPWIERPEPRSSASPGGREGDRRAVKLLLDARGDPPDDALVPRLVEEANGASLLHVRSVQRGEGIELHVAFDRAPLTVQFVELARQLQGALEAVCRKTLDADRHVGQSPRSVDAWANREAEIARAR